MERRQFNRIIFEADAQLGQSDRQWPVALHDLSLKGALISKPEHFNYNLDEYLNLRLNLEGSNHPINMKMIVSHSGKDFIGLETRNIDIDSATELRTLMELNLGDHELLERDIKALCQA